MPKSRRDKPVSLTKPKKHGRASKERLVSDIRECVGSYGGVYVFEVENMRNVKFKELREEWGGSRFFLGKNRVMQMALGRDPQDEQRPGISELTPVSAPRHAHGSCVSGDMSAQSADLLTSSAHGRLRQCPTIVILLSTSLVSADCFSQTPARRTC